jgi:hypothetical protein
VGLGKTLQPVDPHEIEYIRKATSVGAPAQPWPFLKVGWRITAGP